MQSNRLAAAFRAALLIGTAQACTLAGAATFGLSPMRVDLSGATPTAVLTVTNGDEQPLTIQVQTRSWRQNEGRDEQAPTGDLILNPALATIPPGGEQIIRIALRTAPDRTHERAYRLVVREVPLAAEKPAGDSLRVALAMDIPLFVEPIAKEGTTRPAFALERNSGTPRIRIGNDGERHLRLTDLVVSQAGSALIEQAVMVILPGAVRYLPLPVSTLSAGVSLVLKAQSNIGPIETAIDTPSRR